MDYRTMCTRLRKKSGCDFVTFEQVCEITGLSMKQARNRLKDVDALHTRPKKFFIEHAARALTR